MSAADRVAARLYGTILATTDDLPDDLAVGVEAALAALPVEEVVAWLVERHSLSVVAVPPGSIVRLPATTTDDELEFLVPALYRACGHNQFVVVRGEVTVENVATLVGFMEEVGLVRRVPDLWVYDGPERHVEGVPFGHAMRPGDGYRGDGVAPSRPVYVVEPPPDRG